MLRAELWGTCGPLFCLCFLLSVSAYSVTSLCVHFLPISQPLSKVQICLGVAISRWHCSASPLNFSPWVPLNTISRISPLMKLCLTCSNHSSIQGQQVAQHIIKELKLGHASILQGFQLLTSDVVNKQVIQFWSTQIINTASKCHQLNLHISVADLCLNQRASSGSGTLAATQGDSGHDDVSQVIAALWMTHWMAAFPEALDTDCRYTI